MSLRKRFCYVDACAGKETWRRIKIEEVDEKLRSRTRNQCCFYSVQRYDDPVHKGADEKGAFQEDQWLGLFFDFDKEGEEEVPRRDALGVVNFFLSMGIKKECIRVWFSGRRGFHVIVEPEVFGIEPSRDLTYAIKLAAMSVAAQLSLSSFDDKVYSIRRQFRLADSIHEKSGLFKVEVSHEELAGTMDSILATAKSPRGERHGKEHYDQIETSTAASAWWQKFNVLHQESRRLKSLAPINTITRPVEMVGEVIPPVCVRNMMSRSSLPKPNSGNKAVLALAAFYRDAGIPMEQAEESISTWACGLSNIGDSGNHAKVVAGARSVTRYVYRHEEKCSFACPFILALGTEGDKIPCEHLACRWIDGKEQVTKEVIRTNLAGASHAEYQKQMISLPVRISGKAQTPYVVPRKVEITCSAGENDVCASCALTKYGGTFQHVMDERDDTILSILDQWTLVGRGYMRQRFGIPKGCNYHRIKNLELQNVEELRLIPPAEPAGSTEKTEYVVRKAYYLYRDEADRIGTNRSYEIEGVPAAEPKTQHATLVFAKAKSVESEIDKFEMTPEAMEQLKLFQPEFCDVTKKFDDIHADLEANITSIWGRRELAISYDLVFHSARAFHFQFAHNIKGWVELLVVGESGCGKTSTVIALRRHYRAGDLLSGGTSRRTGLAYSLQQVSGTWVLMWGALPLNDLGLVVIDEFSDLKPEDFALLTDARSSGIIKVAGVISDETNARVRLICLTNPKLGRTLGSYQNGCESLRDLVPGPEDIRRFDFAMAVASGDVPPELLNRSSRPEVQHVYTSHLCNLLVRWAWSRRPDDVQFTPEATAAILEAANAMSKKYAAGEIPLAEPSDQRYKLARLSAAAAARVFSTDATGEKLIVGLEHVKFVSAHLESCYTNPHFKYDEWSAKIKKRSPDADRVKEIAKFLRGNYKWHNLICASREIDKSFTAIELETMAAADRETSKEFLSELMRRNLVQTMKGGRMIRTPLFIAVLKATAGDQRPPVPGEFDTVE